MKNLGKPKTVMLHDETKEWCVREEVKGMGMCKSKAIRRNVYTVRNIQQIINILKYKASDGYVFQLLRAMKRHPGFTGGVA